MNIPTPDADLAYDPVSDLAQLRKDAEQIQAEPIRLPHPYLPQYSLLFRSDLDINEVEGWRRKCVTKPARNGRDEQSDVGKFARMVVAGANVGILRGAAEVTDADGLAVTFSNREFQAQFGVATSVDAVKQFIRHDAGIGSLSAAIIDGNHYGDEVVPVDPTDAGGRSPNG